ncbi:hypothetical protein [Entomomonas moraniae]|uniref:hypothetical protein n=1 Tax=Entomomonas moraniae TaxID=2213226 RepID=UPI000F8F3851|nr:hypothetical protein [Entomomonas moraniae]
MKNFKPINQFYYLNASFSFTYLYLVFTKLTPIFQSILLLKITTIHQLFPRSIFLTRLHKATQVSLLQYPANKTAFFPTQKGNVYDKLN